VGTFPLFQSRTSAVGFYLYPPREILLMVLCATLSGMEDSFELTLKTFIRQNDWLT
jgi:hypothetical protein